MGSSSQTSKTFRTRCPLLKSQKNSAYTTCGIGNGSSSLPAPRQVMVYTRVLIGCLAHWAAKSEGVFLYRGECSLAVFFGEGSPSFRKCVFSHSSYAFCSPPG